MENLSSQDKDPLSLCSGFDCRQQQQRHAAAPPPTGVRRRMERNRQKPVGRDKGSLTEQQTEGTATTTIQMRRKAQHKPQNRARRTEPPSPTGAVRSRAASEFPPPRSPSPEPKVRAHRVEYRALFGQVGSARLEVPLPEFQ